MKLKCSNPDCERIYSRLSRGVRDRLSEIRHCRKKCVNKAPRKWVPSRKTKPTKSFDGTKYADHVIHASNLIGESNSLRNEFEKF